MSFRRAFGQERPGVLDFTTEDPEFREDVGIGITRAKIPRVLGEVTLDGQTVELTNPETLDRIHTAAIGLTRLRRRRVPMDCVGFTALFSGAIDKNVRARRKPTIHVTVGEERLGPGDLEDGRTYMIGARYHDDRVPRFRHALVAVDTSDGMRCFHVLGNDGPLALSGIDAAMVAYQSWEIRTFDTVGLPKDHPF
jgi:hypothetical protein